MAATATLSVDHSVLPEEQPCFVTATFTGDGSNDLTVTEVVRTSASCQSVLSDDQRLTGLAVPHGLTTKKTFKMTGFIGQPESLDYPIGLSFIMSDGSQVNPNTPSVRCISPLIEQYEGMPADGQFRLDSNNNSYVLALL